jgi:hypothetical protein
MARSILRTRRFGLVRPGMLMIALVAMVAVNVVRSPIGLREHVAATGRARLGVDRGVVTA